MRYHLAEVEFELVDGGRYRVVHPTKGARYFRCLLDGNYLLIAPDSFVQLPWITIAGVFTPGELKSLTRVD